MEVAREIDIGNQLKTSMIEDKSGLKGTDQTLVMLSNPYPQIDQENITSQSQVTREMK